MSAKKKRRKKKKRVVKKPSFWKDSRLVYGLIGVLIITFIAFIPSLQNGFVNWDDDVNLLENPNLNDFTWEYIKAIFTETVIGNYNPLTIFSFAVEKHFFGLNPTVYHVNNLILHLLCTYFVYRILYEMKLGFWGALFGTLLFGIHPMRVESVAWVTERKDVLFSAFYLPAFWLYIKSLKYPSRSNSRTYWIMLLFILSVLSKIQAVALPLSMLCVDYLYGRKWSWKLITEKIPYFAISLIMGLVGIYFLGEQGSLEASNLYAMHERFIVGAYTYMIYLVKAVVPYLMSPLYPYPGTLPWHMYAVAPLVLLVIAVAWYAHKNNHKTVVYGLLFFTVNVVFLLQVLGAGQGFLADRFTYIPYLGLFHIAGFYFGSAMVRWKGKRNLLLGGAGAYILVLGVVSWQQCTIWKNGGTMWSHVIEHYDNTPLPFGNRGNYYRDNGEYEKALEDYNRAIELDPDRHATINSRAKLHFTVGNLQKALQDYNRAIGIKPQGEYIINRGATHARLGNMEQAMKDLNKGLNLKPQHATGYMNRSILHSAMGNFEKQIEDLTRFIELDPSNPDIFYERGRARRRLNRLQPALQDFNRAIRMNPQKGMYYYERSKVYMSMGQKGQARQDFLRARQLGADIEPEYAKRFQ